MAKINVIKPSFEILSDHMPMVPKAAKMARICYRTEDPQDATKEAKMLNSCISAGHTSVIEHGYMSVFFPSDPIDPKRFGDERIQQPLSASMIWSQFNSDDISKYTEVTGDNQIYKYVDGQNAPMKVYPVVVSNFRAWLNIIDSAMASAIESPIVSTSVFAGAGVGSGVGLSLLQATRPNAKERTRITHTAMIESFFIFHSLIVYF